VSQNDELRPLSPEELAAETGAALPDKEVISLLDLNADLDIALDAAAPIDLAVAANANVAAPIDAAVAANILSDNSESTAIAQQDAIITQTITGSAVATSDQVSDIDQSSLEPVDTDTASTEDPAVAAVTATEVPAVDSATATEVPAVDSTATEEPAVDATTATDEPATEDGTVAATDAATR
jgi:hypothetical protein